MNTTTSSGTVEGNNAGTHKTWPQSVTGGQGLGCAVKDSPRLGARNAQPTRLCIEASSTNSRRSLSGQQADEAGGANAANQEAASLTQEAALTLPVTLRFNPAQLRMLAQCVEYEGKRTVGEWITASTREMVVLLLCGCYGAKEDDARALWDGQEATPDHVSPDVQAKSLAVALDAHATRLVQDMVAKDATFSVEDAVNGALYFLLDPNFDESPRCFDAARTARSGKEVA